MTLDPVQCWQSVQCRDATQDGRFFFGVMTTGVFCRPSCSGRAPLRKNVRFYETPAEASRDGLRPCRRCRPLEEHADPAVNRIRAICRFLDEHPDETHRLADLAHRAGLSPHHFQRRFKNLVGVTPREYASAVRLKTLKNGLRSSPAIADAIYDAGFGSSSRVYERADASLGMTPRQYRQGGRGIAISHVTIESPLGTLMLGASDRGIAFLQFGNSEKQLRAALAAEYPNADLERVRPPYSPLLQRWVDALQGYFAQNRPQPSLPLDVSATAFQTRVWSFLQRIPRGETRSYGDVARGIGEPNSARAIARACATNRVAIVIPCHRVIRGSGDLGGYRWGVARKRALLDLERHA